MLVLKLNDISKRGHWTIDDSPHISQVLVLQETSHVYNLISIAKSAYSGSGCRP